MFMTPGLLHDKHVFGVSIQSFVFPSTHAAQPSLPPAFNLLPVVSDLVVSRFIAKIWQECIM